MEEPILGLVDLVVEILPFEISQVADGLAALETLFMHYEMTKDMQEEFCNSILIMTAAMLAERGTLIIKNEEKIETIKVEAAIPVPSEPLLEKAIKTQDNILDIYSVTKDHSEMMKRAVTLYASCHIYNHGQFPSPGIPDLIKKN